MKLDHLSEDELRRTLNAIEKEASAIRYELHRRVIASELRRSKKPFIESGLDDLDGDLWIKSA